MSTLVRRRSGLWVPGRSFPVIPTAANGRIVSSVQPNTTSIRVYPDLSSLTKTKGDLLLAIGCTYGTSISGVFTSLGGGFSVFANLGSSGNMAWCCGWKVSDGTETGTFNVTQGGTISGHWAGILLSIAGGHQTTPPENTVINNASASAADPVNFIPSWGLANTLFISCAGNGETVASNLVTIAANSQPTNYSGQYTTGPSGSAVVGEIDVGLAFRQLRATADNVGPWTVDTTSARNSAFLIGVRPA